jgi:hypothetical protein
MMAQIGSAENSTKEYLMKSIQRLAPSVAAVVLGMSGLQGCSPEPAEPGTESSSNPETFGEDVSFLSQHVDTEVLQSEDGQAKIAVVGAYQGRVMTSTTAGDGGPSFGWINYTHIKSGKMVPHINVFGGEDRFWLGPEGGQYSIFFKEGNPYDLEHWQTPPFIDTIPYTLAKKTSSSLVYEKEAEFVNKSGRSFKVRIDRTISMLNAADVEKLLGTAPPKGVQSVAYASDNKLTNKGDEAWTKKTGLLSIWILGMFKPGAYTTVVVPFKAGSEEERGPKVNDAYFGKVPADRLVVKDDVLFFKGDGEYRSKIGLSPQRAKAFCGSYDPAAKVLTLVHLTIPEGAVDYVNSMWEDQKEPFAGDVVNSYNDGPPAPGKKALGPFYELESSSPALALKPGESASHVHTTIHFQGDEAGLDALAQKVLGVDLKTIQEAF